MVTDGRETANNRSMTECSLWCPDIVPHIYHWKWLGFGLRVGVMKVRVRGRIRV